MSRIRAIETLGQDVRYAVRMLRKSPGFTVVAALSLALGIGVNTAMFSVVNAVLLRALPYPAPGELVAVGRQLAPAGGGVMVAEYEFLRDHAETFASVAGQRGAGDRRLVSGATQEWIGATIVTTDFLRTLGVRPALGREIEATEATAGGPQAVVISDSLWRRVFGADPRAIGRAVTLDGVSFTVVGVLPAGFWLPQPTDALIPLRPTGSLGDGGTNTQVVARLADGVTIQKAQAELASLSQRFRANHPGGVPDNYRGWQIVPYQDVLVGDVSANLYLLFGATGLLLLISCANLAMLLLTRVAARRKEIALRLALGSSRGRLFAQSLVEHLMIAALGSAVGLAAAYALLRGLLAWMPFDLPASTAVRLDGAVLLFTLGIALATALAFTLVPLLTARRLNLQDSLRSGGRTAGGDRVRLSTRNALVIGQVALSTTLLIAAGLLIQSLWRMQQERLGFTPQGLMTFEMPLAVERQRNDADRLTFTRAMLERLQAVPGVRGVAATDVLPLTGQHNVPAQRDGHPDESIGGMEVRAVTPAYFELMGIAVREGRSFTDDDGAASLPVAVINETLARAWWPKGSALDDRVTLGRFQNRDLMKDPTRQVIGVVADTKTVRVTAPTRPTIFVPMTQREAFPPWTLAWIVRVQGATPIAAELRRAAAEIDPAQRLRQLRPMEEIVASATAFSRFNASLFGIFAGVAVTLAAIGLYGLLSFLVTQRRQEIGTRMALGANRGDVLKVVLRQGLVLTSIGLALGLAGAVAAAGWLSSLLYGVRPNDPVSFAAVACLLLLVGAGASLLPAWRAARTDPIAALRSE